MMKRQYNLLIMLLCFACTITAQQKLQKISQSTNVDKDVTINLNTSFTDIEIDTWDKNVLEIEAYIESDKLLKEDLQKALKNWDIKVESSGDKVLIFSNRTGTNWATLSGLESLESLGALEGLSVIFEELPALPEMPAIPEMPEVPEFPQGFAEALQMPDFPDLPKLPEGYKSISFDVSEYEDRGEAYLDEWVNKTAKNTSDKKALKEWARAFTESDFEGTMEAWGESFGEKFGKTMEAWGEDFGEKFGEKMERWGEEFGEKWGNEYAKKMERWGESLDNRLKERYGDNYEREIEERAERFAKKLEGEARRLGHGNDSYFLSKSSSKVKKTLKIKMPKDAKLKVNVRHGELKVSSINNLDANISHSTLLANSIDGSSTSIDASYSDVKIIEWIRGDLKLNYVENAILNSVKRLALTSNSSDVKIGNILDKTLIDGSFGDLIIESIDKNFNSLNIILENSDANISLPKTDYELLFKGNRSKFNNEQTDKKVIKSDSDKTIVINAKYSNVVMQ